MTHANVRRVPKGWRRHQGMEARRNSARVGSKVGAGQAKRYIFGSSCVSFVSHAHKANRSVYGRLTTAHFGAGGSSNCPDAVAQGHKER